MKFRAEKLAIKKFRKIENLDNDSAIDLGEKITVFAGQNGVGKSNIMSLISASFGTKHRRATGGNFHPEFDDFFTIPESEDYSEYRTFLNVVSDQNVSIQRRQSFSRHDGRGIRIIPRNTNHFTPESTEREIAQQVREAYKIGPSARIPLLSVFISLSRLFPIGETKITSQKLTKRHVVLSTQAFQKYKEWYNKVLPSSIENTEDNIQTLNKAIDSNRNVLHMPIKQTLPETQSVGQDNVGAIISALVDFYIYKSQNPDYPGGILCIDEIDASLHPKAQLNLLRLLEDLAGELDLQIFITTHSLTVLKEITKLQDSDPIKYKLIYFIDPDLPRLLKISNYQDIKADLFDNMTPYRPDVKIYCEDAMTEFLFLEIIKSYTSSRQRYLQDYKIISVHLGCQQLMQLPDCDSHFQDVLIIVDGDAKTNASNLLYRYIENEDLNGIQSKSMNFNILSLPSFLAPESYIYYLAHKVCTEERYSDFWRRLSDIQDASLYTRTRVKSWLDEMTITSDINNDRIKSFGYIEDLKQFVSITQLFNYLLEQEEFKDVLEFCKNVESKLLLLSKKIKSNKF